MLKESRGSLRIRENLNVTWRLKNRGYQGQGKIFNISTSGALLETKNDFSPCPGDILNVNPFLNESNNFLPEEGRLIWSERKNSDRVLCGLEFIAPEEKTLANLRERIQQKIMQSANHRKIKSIVGIVLFLIMLSLAFFIVKEGDFVFRSMEESSRRMLDISDQQAILTRNYASLYHQTVETLAEVTKELDTTKTLMQQTEDLLNQAKNENTALRNQLAALNIPAQGITGNQAAFNKTEESIEIEEKITILNEKNSQFANELTYLKDQMRSFQGDIKSLEEGKALISFFQNRLKQVKTKMAYLKQEAAHAKELAQKQRDRALFLKGNQGYLVKNGQTFQKDKTPTTAGDQKVEIDVSFVE